MSSSGLSVDPDEMSLHRNPPLVDSDCFTTTSYSPSGPTGYLNPPFEPSHGPR